MTIEDLPYDINREAAKISALSSGKINNYEYLTSEKLLPPDQSSMVEQTQFIYFPLGSAFEKQIKKTEDQERKQIDAIKNQNENLAALTNKDDKDVSHQKYLKNLLKKNLIK